MKRLFYFLIFLNATNLISQNNNEINVFINIFNEKIPIYSSALCDKEIFSVFQDSIFEHFYSIKIINESIYAFEVQIFSASQSNSPIVKGWIEKKYCGVYINSYKNVKLYDKPDYNSDFLYIKLDYDIIAHVISIDNLKTKFIKVGFYIDNKYYEGWTLDYCDNIYDSCN